MKRKDSWSKFYCNCGKELSYQGKKNINGKCKGCSRKALIKTRPDLISYGFKKGNSYGVRFIKGQPPTAGSYKKGHKPTLETIAKFTAKLLGRRVSPRTEFKPSGVKREHRKSEHLQDSKYNSWRKKVFLRDDFTCQMCGVKGERLNAHHINAWVKYPEWRFNLDNGITLCIKCHKLAHKKI